MIRQEHDLLISEMNIVRSQRDELENKGTPLPNFKKKLIKIHLSLFP